MKFVIFLYFVSVYPTLNKKKQHYRFHISQRKNKK